MRGGWSLYPPTCCHTDKGSSSASIRPADITSLSRASVERSGTSTHNKSRLIAGNKRKGVEGVLEGRG